MNRLTDGHRESGAFRCEGAEPAHKRCRKCDEMKPLASFHPKRSAGPELQSQCKPCARQTQKDWRWANLDASRAKERDAARKTVYGVGAEDFERMILAQGGSCAICHGAFSKTPSIDHCHATGAVRELLCSLCNSAIGFLNDDADRCRAAAAYIDKHHELHRNAERANG